MVGRSAQGALLEGQQRMNQRIMKRNNSSAEDMVRSMSKPFGRDNVAAAQNGSPDVPWRIADRCFARLLQYCKLSHACVRRVMLRIHYLVATIGGLCRSKRI